MVAWNSLPQNLGKLARSKIEVRIREAQAKSAEAFKAIGEGWYERLTLQSCPAKTLETMRWMLDKSYPSLWGRPNPSLIAPEPLDVLRKVEVRGQ